MLRLMAYPLLNAFGCPEVEERQLKTAPAVVGYASNQLITDHDIHTGCVVVPPPSRDQGSRADPDCYLPGTAFKSPDGSQYLLVDKLAPGDRVKLADGGEAVVESVTLSPYDKNAKYYVVALFTPQGKFVVSAKHLVNVNTRDALSGRPACCLFPGDEVMVGDRGQKLTKVEKFSQRTELFKVVFTPFDRPVETFMVPAHGLQTFGAPPESRDEDNNGLPAASSHASSGWELLSLIGCEQVSEADLALACPSVYTE
eukprot:TRINITY_DN68827_c0_g1_i1.p2 TRINITY_DN68827_c0_g1~~TRINITY_DN68827_c0_g1_i1.p2  ORF type:complete len:256 (+),score=35.64 TRINITY_DN68827_c0_g1_i1:844-1611(+)